MRIALKSFQNRRLVADFHIQRVGKENVVLLARIYAALEHGVADQLVVGDT